MTSLAHDRLLEQGSTPKNGVRKAPATARTTTARRRAGATEEPAAEPRTRTAQRSTTTRSTGDRRPSTRTTAAKTTAPTRATPKVAPATTAKTTPAATAKAGPAKPAPAKTTKPTATPAKTTTAKTAKPSTAKPAKPTAPKRTPATPVTSEAASARRRPIPRPRPAADAEVIVESPSVDAVAVDEPEQLEPAPLAEIAERRRWFRRPLGLRRRPTLSIAAALVGAVALSTAVVSTEAQADTTTHVSESVSVAKQLGISSSEAQLSSAAAGAELRQMVVSRNERSSEQAHYALVQSRADKAVQKRRTVAAAEAARPKAVLPVKGAKFTSCFCSRWGTFHYGIDLAAPIGTPEYAAMDGVVLEAGPASGFGLAVYIQHANGDVTVYGHMEQILVKAGQVVRAGDTIALLGNRGQSTGPHLHFEVHVGGINGQKVDPIPWLAARGVKV